MIPKPKLEDFHAYYMESRTNDTPEQYDALLEQYKAWIAGWSK